MDTVSSQITLVPLNLRPEETLVQIQRSLKTLMLVSEAVSGEMNKRIQEVQTRVSRISQRVDSAHTVVNHLLTINNKAIKVFSSASYPVEGYNPFGFTTLNPIVESSPTEEERGIIRKPYSPVDEKRLREKLNFYHVNGGKNQKDSSWRNNKYNEFQSISQLLFYLSSKTRFSTDALDQSDMATSLDWRSAEKELNALAPLLGDAPPSIKRRGGVRKIRAGNLYYQPQIAEHPAIEVPLALPDLPGIAEGFSTEEGVAISLPLPSLPDLSTLLRPEEVQVQDEVVEVIDDLHVGVIKTPHVSTPLPPPPLLVQPVSALPKHKKDEIALTERKETDKEATSEGVLDMRSSLMDAIRQAGGAGKAKLKSVVKTPSEVHTQEITRSEKQKSEFKPGGDLMSDLMAKLSTRRKGISGPPVSKLSTPAQPSAPSGIFEKMSSLISQPEEDSQPDEEEDTWNDN